MSKKYLTLLFVSIIACVFMLQPSLSIAKAPTYTIKLGHHSVALDKYPTDPPVVNALIFKRIVEAETNGDVIVKIYPNFKLGDTREMTESTQMGAIQATINYTSVFTIFSKKIALLQIPYIFPNAEVAMRVLRGPFGDELAEAVRAETGLRILNWCEGIGFRQFYSKKPIFTPADMKGMKFRVPENKGLLLMFRGMGAGVVTIPWSELYTALQTGVAEGAETESSSGLVIKLNEVIKYLTISNHAYNIQPLLMNDAFYKKLPKNYQYIVQKAADQSDRAANGYSRVADYGAIQQYLDAGVTVNFLTKEQKDQFKALAQPPYLKWVTGEVGKEWVDKLMKAIETETAAWDKEIKAKMSK